MSDFYSYDDIKLLVPGGRSIVYIAKGVLKNSDIEWFYYNTYTINFLIYTILISTKGDIIFTITHAGIYDDNKSALEKFEENLSTYDNKLSKVSLALKQMGIINIYIKNRTKEYNIKLSNDNCRDLIFSDILIKSFYILEDMVSKRLEELNCKTHHF